MEEERLNSVQIVATITPDFSLRKIVRLAENLHLLPAESKVLEEVFLEGEELATFLFPFVTNPPRQQIGVKETPCISQLLMI